jgi:regulatory protein
MTNSSFAITEIRDIKHTKTVAIAIHFQQHPHIVVPESYRKSVQGMPLDTVELYAHIEMLKEAERRFIDDIATRFLRTKERSVAELCVHLETYGFTEQIICSLIEQYKQYGYLNDERFARQLAERYMNQKGKSTYWVRQKLLQKDVSSEVIDTVLKPPAQHAERIQATAALDKKFGLNWLEQSHHYRKMQAFLLRSGYPHELVTSLFPESFAGDE